MALEQYKRNCQLFDTTGTASQQYAVEAAKTGDQTGSLAGNFTQDLSGGADMTDALGGGSCPADQTVPINIGGHSFSFVVALSRSCQGLEWLGVALVAATAVACAFIVFKD
ncbi:virulence factor TspB C-terminal domain-related protein [Variovorax sp. W6]|uniref:virulence factor TspB C-terminal domain-related protein n=1 Tax=Variovorax sp. W6 TaxID=3093895 RepID=UPI003D806F7A